MTGEPLNEIEYERDADGSVATEIPETPYYVVGRNTFYSGWGPAGDRDVYDVFPCESREQAEKVSRYARQPLVSLTDVMIVEGAPATGPGRVLVVRSPASVADWADGAD